jgi:hypothetical protein
MHFHAVSERQCFPRRMMRDFFHYLKFHGKKWVGTSTPAATNVMTPLKAPTQAVIMPQHFP